MTERPTRPVVLALQARLAQAVRLCGLALLALLAAVSACTPTPRDIRQTAQLPPIYPDYCNVTIPPNIAPLNFLLRHDSCEALEVKVGVGDVISPYQHTITLRASGNEAVFSLGEWKALLAEAAGTELTVTVTALVGGQWVRYRPFTWQVAKDPIDPWLTYRLIEPDYEIWNNLQIKQRCVENFDEDWLGHYEQLDNRCMNCHTFANQSPDLSMMYVRGPGGGAILNQSGRLQKLDIPGSVYFGFSPNGRYITYSTNTIIPAFHSQASRRLEVFDARSNVFVADLQTHRILTSPLLCDSLKFETFPTFSPDGRYIYYCVADTVALPQEVRQLQYALVRIPFDEQTGQFGSQVDTLLRPQASMPPRKSSVCHPRISPDGRYLLYTVADYGTFPIWHPEADLQMMDLQTGRIDSLSIVNSERSDTYHAWSSNSRWFVFASKRDDGLYGKPYFCYIDPTGRAHKPFCLPQRYPAFYDNNLKSFNAPELGTAKVPFTVSDVAKAMRQDAIPFKFAGRE